MLFTGPHDYFNRDYVQEWARSANSKRPFRARFFDAFAEELNRLSKPKILDLGAGPGLLAEHLLSRCDVTSYHLFDFSPHMLELSCDRLARFGELVSSEQGSFLEGRWWENLPAPFDAVVSIQAVHELRNTSLIPRLYREIRSILTNGGVALIADEVASEADDAGPFQTIEGHLSALQEAGFEDIRQLLAAGDLAMFTGRWYQTKL